ncbi:Hypothetical protein GSB_152534 [Giardia duodenalis]|uniref:Uncharacterized protein n=2 Tax=Giardia intestinalis TaxID=5741 RepID=C6LPC6_GIAIB|nr:Hypothetical protein GL50581_591 [Giardia intestinalis ATCC 50581]ESU44243.1 Hypothetical protein GSB_152534 [Giardia intestinalis]
MELIECLFALAEMRVHHIRENSCASRRRLTAAVHDGLTSYQRTVITIQIDELQRLRLRQFRLLDFLFGLSAADSRASTSLPIYLYTDSTKSSDKVDARQELSSFSSNSSSSSNLSSSLANQYVMFSCPHSGIAYYRPEYVLYLLTKSVLLGRRHRRRFLLPYRLFYKRDEETAYMFLSLREYMVLLPLGVILENFAIVRYHLFANIFCFLVKDLLDVFALFHNHGIVLNGDFSHLCVDRLSGRIKLNLCTYSVLIPHDYHAGIKEDLHTIVKLILRYTADSTLYPISDVREQLLQIAHSMQQAISQDYDDHLLLIPSLPDVAKCLAQCPVFFSNAYPPISIINTDIVEVFTIAQEVVKEMQVASIDETADSVYPLADSTPRAGPSPSCSPESQHEPDNWFTTVSYRSLPPVSTTLLGNSAAVTPAKRSCVQGLEFVDTRILDDSPLRSDSTPSIVEASPETRLTLELKVGPPPPILSEAVRISDRYTHSCRIAERIRRETIEAKSMEAGDELHDVISCAKTSDCCLPPTKLFSAVVPRFPSSAMSVLQVSSPQFRSQRAISQPLPSNIVTTLRIAGPCTSPINVSHALANTHVNKGRKASFGGSALTTKALCNNYRNKSQPVAVIVPVSREVYMLNISDEAMARKPIPPIPLRQPALTEAKHESLPQTKNIGGLTIVAPPAFPPAPKQTFRRHSHSAAPPLSQSEVTESISRVLGAQEPYRCAHIPPPVIRRPMHQRSFSAQSRNTSAEDLEGYDVFYSRVTLHAPKFVEPIRRVLIERNYNFAAPTPKVTKDINPIEELNQALVNYY